MMEFVDDNLYKLDSSSKDYFYFLKLVPHVFVDEIHSENYNSYSYSLNHNAKVLIFCHLTALCRSPNLSTCPLFQ